jgi:hypothetical protein
VIPIGTRVVVLRDLKAEAFPVPSCINMVGRVTRHGSRGTEVQFDLRPNPAWFQAEEIEAIA